MSRLASPGTSSDNRGQQRTRFGSGSQTSSQSENNSIVARCPGVAAGGLPDPGSRSKSRSWVARSLWVPHGGEQIRGVLGYFAAPAFTGVDSISKVALLPPLVTVYFSGVLLWSA